MVASASWAVLASCPSLLRVRRDAVVIRLELPEEVTRKTITAATTTSASSGSRTNMTTTMTRSVSTLAASGRPAVTATSCMRAMSETRRWTVSALRLRAWNCWDRPATCRKARARSAIAVREPASAKDTVAR